jgi:hypothetical protein
MYEEFSKCVSMRHIYSSFSFEKSFISLQVVLDIIVDATVNLVLLVLLLVILVESFFFVCLIYTVEFFAVISSLAAAPDTWLYEEHKRHCNDNKDQKD